jgi:multidrug efflux pump subunit AcrB
MPPTPLMSEENHMTDLTILLLMLMMGASPATHLAQPGTSSTPRIDHGVASGALTEKEATRLQKEQDRVQKAEDKAMEDGKVTKMERARIERRQDQASEHIYSQKHDRQRAN